MATATSLTCGSNLTGICSSNGAKSYYVDENGNMTTIGTVTCGDVTCGDVTAGDVDCQALTCTSFNIIPTLHSCVFTMDSNDGGRTGTFHMFNFTITRFGTQRFMAILPASGKFSVASKRALMVRLNSSYDFWVIPVADQPGNPLFADYYWKKGTSNVNGQIWISQGNVTIGADINDLRVAADGATETELVYQQVISWTVTPGNSTPIP